MHRYVGCTVHHAAIARLTSIHLDMFLAQISSSGGFYVYTRTAQGFVTKPHLKDREIPTNRAISGVWGTSIIPLNACHHYTSTAMCLERIAQQVLAGLLALKQTFEICRTRDGAKNDNGILEGCGFLAETNCQTKESPGFAT